MLYPLQIMGLIHFKFWFKSFYSIGFCALSVKVKEKCDLPQKTALFRVVIGFA